MPGSIGRGLSLVPTTSSSESSGAAVPTRGPHATVLLLSADILAGTGHELLLSASLP